MSQDLYEAQGWDGWKPSYRTALPTRLVADLPDRDELADLSYDFIASPVETKTGNDLRLRGIDLLEHRVSDLQARGDRQRLTSIETRELMDSQSTIHTLQRMAPVGLLQPAHKWELD